MNTFTAEQLLKKRTGFGAFGASEFTMSAARALNVYLTTNGCAGCDDIKSQLRQLTFTFKAACLTDPTISPNVSLNVSTPLAMTGFGPGSNAALSLVLDVERTYMGGPCTDSDGNCVAGGLPTPQIPAGLEGTIASVLAQIRGLIGAQQNLPPAQQALAQGGLLATLVTLGAALLNQLGFEAQKLTTPGSTVKEETVIVTPPPPPPPPAPMEQATGEKKSFWQSLTTGQKFLLGGTAGVAVAGGGILLYRVFKR